MDSVALEISIAMHTSVSVSVLLCCSLFFLVLSSFCGYSLLLR